MKKICRLCKVEYNARHTWNKFCSYYCAVRGRPGYSKKLKPSYKNCFNCKKSYLLRQKSQKVTRKYCSRKCYAIRKKETVKGQSNPNWKGGISRRSGVSGNNKHYIKGRYYERKTKKILENLGYYVMRSGGSLGMIDLIAFNKSEVKLIQVKSGISPFTQKDREELKNLIAPFNVSRELWRWISGFKPKIEIIS